MGKVFVVSEPFPRKSLEGRSFDLTPAERFGQLVYIFKRDTFAPSQHPDLAVERAREVLHDFSDNDYLVQAGGDPVGMVIAAAVASEVNHGRITFLKWDRRVSADRVRSDSKGNYIPVPIQLMEGEASE